MIANLRRSALVALLLVSAGCGGMDYPGVKITLNSVSGMTGRVELQITVRDGTREVTRKEIFGRDEHNRADTTIESLGGLQASFVQMGATLPSSSGLQIKESIGDPSGP